MSQTINHTDEAGPRTSWLDPSDDTPSASGLRKKNQVMGFDEVAAKTAVVAKEHCYSHEHENEGEDEDDLVLTTNELCRTNSFDFVAQQAQADEYEIAMAELIQKSLRFEGLSEPPVPGVLNSRDEVEEFEMLDLGRSHDIEAARPGRTDEASKRTLSWVEALSKRIETVCDPYSRSYR